MHGASSGAGRRVWFVGDSARLEALLKNLDGKGYGAYKALRGSWRFPGFTLHVDHVQGDPFAAPSRLRIIVPSETALFPDTLRTSTPRLLATAHVLADDLAARAAALGGGGGSGRSGDLVVNAPSQAVLPQTAVQLHRDGTVDARLGVGLPARGRRVLAKEAARLLLVTLPELVRSALVAAAHDPDRLSLFAETNEDAEHLRALLPSLELVAFVADGAILPRRSGVDDRPLPPDQAVPFQAPDSLRVEVTLPNRGAVTGMGIPSGVTLVVGGGFHGKSTLLRALQDGVYNHVPGDGRERVVTVSDAVKIRAEDGRGVAGVDISPFINRLPLGRDTLDFTTPNASGSTSQAAAIVEALEAGSRTLLMDEDTCATNFMIRDRRMQTLVPKEREPITPFVDRVREMHRTAGVSTILVLGGSGDYLDVADTVLSFQEYRVTDETPRARQVAERTPTGRQVEVASAFRLPEGQRPEPGTLDPSRGRRSVSVKVPDARTVLFGKETVDVAAVEQVVGRGQLRALGAALALASADLIDGHRTLAEILDGIQRRVEDGGLDALDPRHPGDFTGFRRYELAALLNRTRSLSVL